MQQSFRQEPHEERRIIYRLERETCRRCQQFRMRFRVICALVLTAFVIGVLMPDPIAVFPIPVRWATAIAIGAAVLALLLVASTNVNP